MWANSLESSPFCTSIHAGGAIFLENPDGYTEVFPCLWPLVPHCFRSQSCDAARNPGFFPQVVFDLRQNINQIVPTCQGGLQVTHCVSLSFHTELLAEEHYFRRKCCFTVDTRMSRAAWFSKVIGYWSPGWFGVFFSNFTFYLPFWYQLEYHFPVLDPHCTMKPIFVLFEDHENKIPFCQKKKEKKETFLALRPWAPSLQNCEKIKFCCLSHSVWGILLWQPKESNMEYVWLLFYASHIVTCWL